MYFKRLEMFGFKSFAERTKINFERGITTIVGPNGCGKSNLVDGIKWVLGEQSAKALRGSSMEDIIFNGTDLREPLGFAEVSLILSNEKKILPIEYNEVTITRRLYRSGESEYFINKNSVRLKDINEMLMGSGIGTEAYSLIEQGRIDQILSANPEDRRIVFEEASGITKYKSKKREAIRKLEYTEQNLVRVSDIIKEVERQINSIERQAKKAKRYQELFDRLKGLDTNLAAYKYSQMKVKKEAHRNENNNIKDKEHMLSSNIIKLNKDVDELRFKLDNLNSKISQYRSDYKDTVTSLQRNEDRINLDRERLQELYKYETEQKKEISSLEARVADIRKTIDGVKDKLNYISENTKSKEDLLAAKEEELFTLKDEIIKKDESIKNNKLKAVDILATQSRLRNEIVKITSDKQNISARLRRLNLEKENVSKELLSLDKSLSEARLSANITLSKVETLEKERIGLQNNLKKEREKAALLEKKIDDSKNYILSLHSKLNFIKELLKRHEGFIGGTQAILNSLSTGRLNIEGLCAPMAELLEPQKGYEAACEAALSEYLQMIVVDDWKAAFSAIEFLKKDNLGKASFIKNSSTIPKGDGFSIDNKLILGNITRFMKFDDHYKMLFIRLLKDTFLVNNIEDGVTVLNSLSSDIQNRVRLVTLKGDIITKDMITGGSSVKDFTSSIMGRRMRVEETERDIAEGEKNILKLKQELHTNKELIEDFQRKIKNAEEALRSEEIELAQKRSFEANLQKEQKKLQEEVNLVDLEIEESMIRNDELLNKEKGLKSRLEEAQRKEADVQNSIMDCQHFIEDGAKRKEGLLVAITQLQTELTSLRKEEDEFYKNAQSQKNYFNEQIDFLNTKRRSLEESYQRQEGLKEEIEKLGIDNENLRRRNQIIEKELEMLEGESLQLKNLMNKEEEALNKEKEDLNSIKDKVHNLQMEETQLAFQMESLRNKISQIYKIDLEEMLCNLTKVDNAQALQEEIDQLNQTIEKIGPVNLIAIDEHKELQERLTFLKSQQEDLINAKESLLKAIRKINQTTRQLFMDTLANIQTEFKNYFRFLFGGGRAEIVLLDEKDILESGIEIIVRPPGKKLQTLSLLSGGEKALTAIALLFAIFKVKPSPFCVLDEIDAPLDESNIGRFSKVLEEFAKTSQFIIITHNKKTISLSDVMYGITMEQSGLSKIISVKFRKEAEKEEPVLA